MDSAPRDERLHGAHHLHVAHVVDRAVADRAVEDRVVVGLDIRCADDRVPLVDERDDLLDLVGRVAELLERHRDGLVHDRYLAATDELLRLYEREVRLDPGRVAIHHEADRSGGCENGRLCVPPAGDLAELERSVPRAASGHEQVFRDGARVVDVADRRAMLRDDAGHCRCVRLVPRERPHPPSDLR